MGERLTTERVSRVLCRAVGQHRPPSGLLHHTDRGSPYWATAYRDLLLRSSMSRQGDGFDNAPIERFWGTLKNERVHHYPYATRAQAEASIREYIEIFYNYVFIIPHSAMCLKRLFLAASFLVPPDCLCGFEPAGPVQ